MDGQENNEKKGKYCQNCGSLIDEKAVMCPKCGAIVGDITQKKDEKEKKPGPMAIISLIAGIVSMPCGWFWGVGLIFAVVAIVLGILDLKSIKEGKSDSQGRGFDITGIVCGGVGILIFIIFITLVIIGVTLSY